MSLSAPNPSFLTIASLKSNNLSKQELKSKTQLKHDKGIQNSPMQSRVSQTYVCILEGFVEAHTAESPPQSF